MQPSTAPVTYEPVGVCIYCGTDKRSLSTEHVIPFGLGGNLKLPKASCDQCADVTKRFEQTCLRTVFGPLRIRRGAPTRRKKARPTALPYAVFDDNGLPRTVTIPAPHIPQSIVLMKLAPPTVLSGQAPEPNFHRGDIWIWFEPTDLDRMKQVYDAKNYVVSKLAVTPFIRMLAKIAHAHAISKLGYGAFTPLLLDVIFNRTNIPAHWVGGDVERPPEEGVLHQLRLDDDFRVNDRRYVVVDVRLFAYLGAPVFRVVVGERQALE